MSAFFRKMRQGWIIETVVIFGFIQRKHIAEKFETSLQQATKDLQEVIEQRPHLLVYDNKLRAYRLKRDERKLRVLVIGEEE